MARANLSLCLLTFLLCTLVCYCSEDSVSAFHKDDGLRWCVATVGAPENKLQGFLDFCCSQLDCRAIKPGGECYEPNNVRNHASYALDLWFRVHGQCVSDVGTPSVTDPSFGRCRYP